MEAETPCNYLASGLCLLNKVTFRFTRSGILFSKASALLLKRCYTMPRRHGMTSCHVVAVVKGN